jgi:ribosomal subunit interface protein
MEIEIHSHGFAVTSAIRGYLAKRLSRSLAPYARHVRRVVARVADANGPRGGNDKSCRVGVSIAGSPDIFAADTRADLYSAIDCAIERLTSAVAKRIQRRRAARSPHRRHARLACALTES